MLDVTYMLISKIVLIISTIFLCTSETILIKAFETFNSQQSGISNMKSFKTHIKFVLSNVVNRIKKKSYNL